MGLSKGASSWSVEEVLEWMQEQYPTQMTPLHKAVIQHEITGTTCALNFLFLYKYIYIVLGQINGPLEISLFKFAGRVLLRLKDHQLALLGVEDEEQQQDILQGLLLLRVQEEINELTDICSGETAKWLHLQVVAEIRSNKKVIKLLFGQLCTGEKEGESLGEGFIGNGTIFTRMHQILCMKKNGRFNFNETTYLLWNDHRVTILILAVEFLKLAPNFCFMCFLDHSSDFLHEVQWNSSEGKKGTRLTFFFFNFPTIHSSTWRRQKGGIDGNNKRRWIERRIDEEWREKETHFRCEIWPVQMDEISFCLSVFFWSLLSINLCLFFSLCSCHLQRQKLLHYKIFWTKVFMAWICKKAPVCAQV